VRLWAIDNFKVLPTDERYLSMPFEWLEYLFLNYINNYGYDDRRDFYLKELYKSEQRQKYEKEVEGLHDDLISLLGYDDKEAQGIIRELKGMNK